jgi:hypothetical protein
MSTRSEQARKRALAADPETPDAPPSGPRRAEPRIKRPGQGDLIPFLTLEETLPETVPVKIFGELYDMIAPQDMSPLDRYTTDQIWQRMVELQGKADAGEEYTREDRVEMEAAINRMIRMVIPALPTHVFNRLNWVQREAIVEGFLARKASRMTVAQMAAEMETETGDGLLTGRTSSPDSSPATTPPTRSSGRKSRPTSSGRSSA